MKKYLICLIITVVAMIQTSMCSYAISDAGAVKYAVKKYQVGNYAGCIQDCLNITYHNPKNALAYYYLGMAYTQAGNQEKALSAYNKVIDLKANPTLTEYATTGVTCLTSPADCPNATSDTEAENEVDSLIAAPAFNGLSSSVKKDLEQQQLNNIKQQINSGRDIDVNSLKLLNDASKQVNPDDKTAQKKPSEEEVAAALKVLDEAGINPYSTTAAYQNPQAMQLQMLSAFNNNPVANPNDSNVMLNMIPQMMAQSKSGQGSYSPQLMQAFIMNTLTGNMNTDFSNNNENN